MQTPEISVIVPVYNAEKTLERCVQSLREQSLGQIEIILVDDGSGDGSGALCDRLAKRDRRIRVLHKTNAGQGMARNDGIEAARGVYVAFVDADDYMEKEAYAKAEERLRQTGADAAAFGYAQLDEQGKLLYQACVREHFYKGEQGKKEFLLHFFGDDPQDDDLRGVSACMSCYRREILMRHGVRFPSERSVLSEDTVFNLEFFRYAKSAVTIAAPLYRYCLQRESFSRGYRPALMEKTIAFCSLLRRYAAEAQIEKETENRICMLYWTYFMEAVRQEVRQTGEKAGQRAEQALREKLRELCALPETGRYVGALRTRGMALQQKLFRAAVRRRWAAVLILMARLRERRG